MAEVIRDIAVTIIGKTPSSMSDINQPLKNAKKIPEHTIAKESKIVPTFSLVAF